MLSRLVAMFFVVIGFTNAAYGNIATVQYLADYIKLRWNIEIPQSDGGHVFDMQYLTSVIDWVNQYNGFYTDYSYEPERANGNIVTTFTAYDTLETLVMARSDDDGADIDCEDVFCFTTSSYEISFRIGAAGYFKIYWGDGTEPTIVDRSYFDMINGGEAIVSHKYYDYAREHEVKITGQASYYKDDNCAIYGSVCTISFEGSAGYIKSMRGSLGYIFPRLSQTSSSSYYIPKFNRTFLGQREITEIPETLFHGIYGQPSGYMFRHTFYGCTNLKSIPDNLFSEFSGAPGAMAFYSTFGYCRKITEIPETLFSTLYGEPGYDAFEETFQYTGITDIPELLFSTISAPSQGLFERTFMGCASLTNIPKNLFSNISGELSQRIFNGTFSGCSSLTEIPDGLFDNFTAPETYQHLMFDSTFADCTSLRGNSAKMNGKYLYDIWTSYVGSNTYRNCTGLDDYNNIPDDWK